MRTLEQEAKHVRRELKAALRHPLDFLFRWGLGCTFALILLWMAYQEMLAGR